MYKAKAYAASSATSPLAHTAIQRREPTDRAHDGKAGRDQDRRGRELVQVVPQLQEPYPAQRPVQQQDGAADQAERQGGAEVSGQPMVHAG